MERRWFDIGERVRVRREEEYDWQLQGDPLPDGVYGRLAVVIPARTVQGVQVAAEGLFPLSFIQLDDGRMFVVHQDNLEDPDKGNRAAE